MRPRKISAWNRKLRSDSAEQSRALRAHWSGGNHRACSTPACQQLSSFPRANGAAQLLLAVFTSPLRGRAGPVSSPVVCHFTAREVGGGTARGVLLYSGTAAAGRKRRSAVCGAVPARGPPLPLSRPYSRVDKSRISSVRANLGAALLSDRDRIKHPRIRRSDLPCAYCKVLCTVKHMSVHSPRTLYTVTIL